MKYNIALAQYPIGNFESLEIWKIHIENWFFEAKSKNANLLCFPEYGSMELVSLFEPKIQSDLKAQLFEIQKLLNDFILSFEALSKKYDIVVIAPSFPILLNSKFVNRTFVFSKNGLAGFQDKFFMTRFENEIWGISSGEKTLSIFQDNNCVFGIQICYDIEFGIGSQLLNQAGANLILAPSCTETLKGASRVHIGARARALENQCFVGVSQTILNADWSPAVDINYGYAAIYTPPDSDFNDQGILAINTAQVPCLLIETLDFNEIENVRKNGQVLNYLDNQNIETQLRSDNIKVNRIVIQ